MEDLKLASSQLQQWKGVLVTWNYKIKLGNHPGDQAIRVSIEGPETVTVNWLNCLSLEEQKTLQILCMNLEQVY